ncbi:uncharacterized protein HKW66_Vig0045360 [Vigna angularis]|uniref:Uncharacterized protein n=1 Tax=Phaseolus angularis TaxID=3914 RepID=A0A8T0L0X6_PHAAN|nr:uncharacterized protein HKW66_Vig0045360 [Vigna angularis]
MVKVVPWGFGVLDDGAPTDPGSGYGDLAHPPAVVVKDVDLLAGREGGSGDETQCDGSEFRFTHNPPLLLEYQFRVS